jgi:cytoskeletal protein CcmA (bactofilin family)
LLERKNEMFRTGRDRDVPGEDVPERVTSVLGEGTVWSGKMSGTGGIRIEGAFDGEIAIRGLVLIGPSGRVTSDHIRAEIVVIAGSLKGDITAHKVEITGSGRVWGDVVASSFSTEEGAFLRGKITMEEEVDLEFSPPPVTDEDAESLSEEES